MITLLALLLATAASAPEATEPGEDDEDADADPAESDGEGDDDDVDDDGEVRTIVITGTRTEHTQRDAPVATQVYGRQEIEDSGAENLAEVLEETPGVQVMRGIGGGGFGGPTVGGVGISMQGLGPKYTVVLIDGQRTTGRVNGVMDLSRFPAEEIEQVELVRGPSSVLYGADAVAGSVNLISRRPKKDHEGEAHFAYGSLNTVDLAGRVGFSRRRYRGSVSGGWHRSDGWDADPSDLSTNGPRFSQFNIATTQDLEDLGPFSLGLRGSYLRRDSLQVDDEGVMGTFDRKNRTEAIQATLRPRVEGPSSRLTLWATYNLWRDQFLYDQRGSTELDQLQDTYDHLGQLTTQYDHEIGRHTLTTGADVQLEQITTNRIEPPTVDRQRYAIFAQDDWTPTVAPKITVLPGFRLDYDSFFGFYPTPRIALTMVPNEKWTLRASYGRGYRAPDFREMFLLFSNLGVGYTVQGNPTLVPETSWSTSISAEYRPWSWLGLAANMFDNRLQDAIAFDLVNEEGTDLYEYINIADATTQGVETQATVSILRRLTLDGSYTFAHTRDHTENRPLPGRPRHSGTAGLRYSRPASGTTFRIRSSIFGRRSFFTIEDDVEVDRPSAPFATVDLRVSQRFFRYAQAFAGIENLLNAGNATDTILQPRTYYGGVTIRY